MTRPILRLFLLALFAGLPLQASAVSDVVISQIYGGNGNTFNRDYVELFNRGSSPVNIAGWSVQYASATGSGTFGSNPVAALTGTLQPGQYYLVGLATTSGPALPAVDASGTVNLSASQGKVALVNTTAGLACNGSASQPCAPADLALIVDLVGYGSANFFEGSAAAPPPSSNTAVFRLNGGCTDTDQNNPDFTTGSPAPRNTASTVNPCGAPTVVPSCPAFSTVQGIAASSGISASDADGLVNAVAFFSGAVTGITLGPLTPSPQPGQPAKVRVEVASIVPQGTYSPVVIFQNNQGQSATCALNISVILPPALVTPIASIQGSGATSPLVGQTRTVRGVVTAAFPGLRGYFIQDDVGDGNPATSEGLFVFTNSTTLPVEVGERVQVTGTVVEFNGSPSAPNSQPITEISAGTAAKVGLSLVTLAPLDITLPEIAEGDLERYEGMLVRITSTLTVAQNFFQGRYGQVTLAANGRLIKPTNVERPGTPAALAIAADNARRRIVLDDGSASESFFSGVENPNPIPYIGADNTLRAGDTVVNLTGVIDYGRITSATGASAITDYKIHPTVTPSFTRTPASARTTLPPAVGGALRVASFNVLNFFTTFTDGNTAGGQSGQGCLPSGSTGDCRGADSALEFARQRDKIVRAIAALDADVVGLIEIQRNGGVATQKLVDDLNAYLNGSVYARATDPAFVGTDAIQQAIIYKTARVTPVGAALSDPAAIHNRPPIAQLFQAVTGAERFSVIVNHFKSKGCADASGADLDQGDGQGCYNDRRKQQASALLTFLSSVQLSTNDPDVVVVGDLNAYGREDPVDILTASGQLQDQVARFAPGTGYSYVFDGEVGYLDHALVTPSLVAQVTGARAWAINADEPSVIDYNTEFKPQDLYAVSPFRSSDHDPVLVGLQLGPPLLSQSITFGALQDRNLGTAAFNVFATSSSGLTVAFTSNTPGACFVSGSVVTLLSTGICTIAADQPGNAQYLPAVQVVQSFTVLPALLGQTISFGPLADRPLASGPFSVLATASSGLAVSFGSNTPAVCSVGGGGTVTLIATGVCTIEATQGGNLTWAAATPVLQSFTITAGSTGGGGGGGTGHTVPLPAWAIIALGAWLAVAFRAMSRP